MKQNPSLKKFRFFYLLTAALLLATAAFSQEPIFGTNLSNSLYSCPSLLSYHNQYSQVGFNYLHQSNADKTMFDSYLMTANADFGGVGRFGLYAMYDKPAISKNEFQSVHALYSHAFAFSRSLFGAVILKGGMTDSKYSLHLYDDRFMVSPFSPINDTLISNQFFDFGSGLIFCARKWNFSFFADHLNRPDEIKNSSFGSRIPVKYTFLAGLDLKNSNNSLSINALYQRQNGRIPIDSYFTPEFNYVSVSATNTYKSHLVGGLGYSKVIDQSDKYHARVGWKTNNIYFSYDFGISPEKKATAFYHQFSVSLFSKRITMERPGHCYNLKGVSGWRYISSGINSYSRPSSKTYSSYRFLDGGSTSTTSMTETTGADKYYLPSGNSNIKAGTLTAGQLNDFGKWQLWTDITESTLKSYQDNWKITANERFSVQLTTEENRVIVDAFVMLKDKDNKTIWTAHTDNTGKAELWSGFIKNDEQLATGITVLYNGKEYSFSDLKKFPDGINVFKIAAPCSVPKSVDIAFLVDATGSMSDELEYLKVELSDVIQKVKDTLPGVSVRLATVFYRDIGDDYVVRSKDFTDNINDAVAFIAQQSAAGGGDGPEAVDSALYVSLNTLSWSQEALSRMAFLVLDASPHSEKPKVIKNLQTTIPQLAEKGIRFIPVSGSGIDKGTEYFLRTLALSTNGTYVFLTDHSMVGGQHIKPTTDEYDVELLNNLLMRLIFEYTYVPSCEKPIDTSGIKDTMMVYYNPVIAHEIIDLSDTLNINNEIVVGQNQMPEDSVLLSSSINNLNDSARFTADSLMADSIAMTMTPSKFIYYPNPTSGQLTIETEGKVEILYLADITGKLLEKYEVKEHIFSITLLNYPTGLYFLMMPVNDNWRSGKVVLVR